MPRFVLLRHECPPSFGKPSHWDFMLEWGEVLRTWDLRELPTPWARRLNLPDAADCVEAFPLADHRAVYLEFEGPLSGNRGSVQRFDQGTYTLLHDSDDSLEVELRGELFVGIAVFRRVGDVWRLTMKEP